MRVEICSLSGGKTMKCREMSTEQSRGISRSKDIRDVKSTCCWIENHHEEVVLASFGAFRLRSRQCHRQYSSGAAGSPRRWNWHPTWLWREGMKAVGSAPPAESPSPSLSDDGKQLVNKYDRAELMPLKHYMNYTQTMPGGVGYMAIEPLITKRFKTFLRFAYSPQGER